MRGHGAHEPACFYWNLALNEGGVSRWGWGPEGDELPLRVKVGPSAVAAGARASARV